MSIEIDYKDVLECLIDGPIPNSYSVYCETNRDKHLLKSRLPNCVEIIELLSNGLCEISSTWRDDHRYSAQACGQYCDEAIRDIIRESLYSLSTKSLEWIKEDLDNLLEERKLEFDHE